MVPEHATDVFEAPDTIPSHRPTQDGEMSRGVDGVGMAGTPDGENQAPAAHAYVGFADEIQALKAKIFELERQGMANPVGPERDTSARQLGADLEERRRMEACLYKHRKEWETKIGPGGFRNPRRCIPRIHVRIPALDMGLEIYPATSLQPAGSL